MLLEFTCSNHKSIRNRVVFSALAGTDSSHPEQLIKYGDELRVLRSALFYGANGSGKSNFIDAVEMVKSLVIGSIRNQVGDGVEQRPHKMNGYGIESEYRMQFVTGGIRYAYGFSLKDMLVLEEYLYSFPNGRQTRIFERSGEAFSFGVSVKSRMEAVKEVLKPNRLLLSCAANFSQEKAIADVFRFFKDELIVFRQQCLPDWLRYSLYEISRDAKLKRAVIDLMNKMGTAVSDIRVKIEKKNLEDTAFPPFLSDEFRKLLSSGESMSAKLVFDQFETDLISEESSGVKKLFSLLCPLIDILRNGKVLFCDELESNLHETLVSEIVKLFVNTEIKEGAQLFFTTHETGFLAMDLFRRDQIWFTEMKEEDRSTDLYSLAEIKNVRKEENFLRGYISGRYGAIPLLNSGSELMV